MPKRLPRSPKSQSPADIMDYYLALSKDRIESARANIKVNRLIQTETDLKFAENWLERASDILEDFLKGVHRR